MAFTDLLTVVFTATLTLCLALTVVGWRRAGQRAVAARISLAVPDAFNPIRRNEAEPGRRDSGFLRYPGGQSHQREMREVVSAFGRWKIARRHALLALRLAEAVSALVVAATGFLISRHIFHFGGAIWIHLPAALIGGAAGWSAPMLLAHDAAIRRAATVARGLPEALELLVVCIEAGLALEDGLLRVTQALKDSQPVLAEELALTAADLKVLANIDEGLANLATRVNLPAVHAVATTLSQSLRYGTPLGDSLRAAAGAMRDEALIRLEERGNRLPTLLTLPMMLLILPTIFLIVGGPAALSILDALGR